ncbi:MAG: tyrosine-type recombinase/integrase [Catenulispora sp.]
MGYSKKRIGKNGKARYTAVYLDLRGHERSAGTYSNKKKADQEWQAAESRQREGGANATVRGRKRFGVYVTETWLPHHVMEASTRESYSYLYNKHLAPYFGGLRMIDIMPATVREWVTWMKDQGATPSTVRHAKEVLSAIFTTALNDHVVMLHACKGVTIPTVPKRTMRIITSTQFDTIYLALPDADSQLLVETAIETGLRWGELTELRVKDLDQTTCILTVSRAVVELNAKFHPEGGRFLVKPYPKDKEPRRFKLSAQITAKLVTHIKTQNLGSDDLFFVYHPLTTRPPQAPKPDISVLGRTEPNDRGKTYAHGTLTAYSAGKCRCAYCKAAYARYRADRRAAGQDSPRQPRVIDTDGHISNDWFRNSVWNPAVTAAKLAFRVRPHDLRHAHASWLLAGGADIQVVKERLGHATIATTEKYLHTLPDADETALDALAKIRRQSQAR